MLRSNTDVIFAKLSHLNVDTVSHFSICPDITNYVQDTYDRDNIGPIYIATRVYKNFKQNF